MDYCGWSTLHVWASPGCPYGCLGKSASIPIPSDPCYPRCGFLWNSCVPNTLSLPSCSIIFSSYHWPFSGRAHFRTQPCVIPCTLLYPKRWNEALKSWWRACRACLKSSSQSLRSKASPNGHWDTVEIKVQPWQRTNPNIANISDCSDNISLILWFSLFHCQAGVPSLRWIIGWMIYQKQSLKPPINCTFVDPTCHENIWKTPAICTIRITLLGDHQDIPLRSWKKDSKNDVVSLQYKKTWNTYTFLNFLGKPYWVFQNC